MPENPIEQRLLAAIMFTDMVGFSAGSQRDEALAVELLGEQQAIVRGAICAHDGREIKTEGDGFLLTFSSALHAVRCAIAIQTAVSVRNGNEPQERRFQLRIGIHVGDVLARGDDLIGDGVNVAARIEPLAEPGGICVTGPVAEQVWNKLSARMVSMGRPRLKNIDAPMEVFRVLLSGQAPASQRAVYRPHRSNFKPFAALGAALALTTVGLYFFVHRHPALDLHSIHSLAVL